MTPERFEKVARFVVQVAHDDPSGEDLVTLALAATYMLPENVRLRERRERLMTSNSRQRQPSEAS
jgi:hypothetical protein